MMQKDWTVRTLEADLPRVLASCRTPFERSIATAQHGIEVRKQAQAQAAVGRLSDPEYEIAARYGFRR